MLLKTIASEDKEFAQLVEKKLLTVQKVMAWDPLTLCEATSRMGDKPLAIALKNLAPDAFDRATYTFREMRKKDVRNFFETLKPSPVEIEAAQIKLIEKIREAIKEGAIRLDENDVPLKTAV